MVVNPRECLGLLESCVFLYREDLLITKRVKEGNETQYNVVLRVSKYKYCGFVRILEKFQLIVIWA